MATMQDHAASSESALSAKIARLVEERGWNQEEFARNAGLHRLTARQILLGSDRRLQNATVQACAQALGLSVHDLRSQPLEMLLRRQGAPVVAAAARRDYESAMQPELRIWLERNPERASRLTPDEMDELLSLQGTGGPLTPFGIAHFVERIERRRRIVEQAVAVAGTELVDLLEQFVGILYEKIQPYASRAAASTPDAET